MFFATKFLQKIETFFATQRQLMALQFFSPFCRSALFFFLFNSHHCSMCLVRPLLINDMKPETYRRIPTCQPQLHFRCRKLCWYAYCSWLKPQLHLPEDMQWARSSLCEHDIDCIFEIPAGSQHLLLSLCLLFPILSAHTKPYKFHLMCRPVCLNR